MGGLLDPGGWFSYLRVTLLLVRLDYKQAELKAKWETWLQIPQAQWGFLFFRLEA